MKRVLKISRCEVSVTQKCSFFLSGDDLKVFMTLNKRYEEDKLENPPNNMLR